MICTLFPFCTFSGAVANGAAIPFGGWHGDEPPSIISTSFSVRDCQGYVVVVGIVAVAVVEIPRMGLLTFPNPGARPSLAYVDGCMLGASPPGSCLCVLEMARLWTRCPIDLLLKTIMPQI